MLLKKVTSDYSGSAV